MSTKRLTAGQIERADRETIERALVGARQERLDVKAYATSLVERRDALAAQERAQRAIEGLDDAARAQALELLPGSAAVVGRE